MILWLVVVLTAVTALPVMSFAGAKVKLNKTKAVMFIGESQTLKLKNARGKVKWTTADKRVATVSGKGEVKAKKTGRIWIRAIKKKKKYKCRVCVYRVNAVKLENQQVGLEGVINARQLGGYRTRSGKKIKKNLIFRSGELAGATDNDLARLRAYHLTRVVDLRFPGDYTDCPDRKVSGADNVLITLIKSSKDYKASAQARCQRVYSLATQNEQLAAAAQDGGCVGKNFYLNLAKSGYTSKQLKRWFNILAKQKKGDAVLFHCIYGKDRTGYVAYMTLVALGVDQKTALKDFALTNEEFGRVLSKKTSAVKAAYMKTALNYIKKKYGTTRKYLNKEVGLTDSQIEKLRAMYLE